VLNFFVPNIPNMKLHHIASLNSFSEMVWHDQLRWKVVEARFEGQAWFDISRRLTIPLRTCMRIWSDFTRFGAPSPPKYNRRVSRRRVMTNADDARLKAILEEDSNLFLDEIADRLTLETRKCISVHQVLSALQVHVQFH
jgi:hypothetical protein